MIQDYFRLLSTRMAAESEMLTDFYRHHPGKLGEAREILLQSFLSTYLPKVFGVGSGFALSSDVDVSTEQDIVIYDALYSPVLFPNARSAIYPHSAIHALIEVKSTLGRRELRTTVEKTLRVKQELRKSPMIPIFPDSPQLEPLVCLFAFSGDDLPSIKRSLIEFQAGISPADRLDLICLNGAGVLSSGAYFEISRFGMPGSDHSVGISETERTKLKASYPDSVLCYELSDHALLVFYYWMISYIIRRPPQFPDLIRYAPHDFIWGNEL
jgi:hypothetical protein